ncbi:MAG: TatD family hydrolase [Pseudomonadota bacterium]
MKSIANNDIKSNVETTLRLIDSHAHIEMEPLSADVPGVIARALATGVVGIITVGIDIDDAQAALKIARENEVVFASIGFHPHNAKSVGAGDLCLMEDLASDPKVVAYGEIGLDFFRNHSPRDVQISVFEDQIDIAKKKNKPLVIHLRDAYSQGLEILEKKGPYASGGVIHCFSGDQSDVQRALDLGFHISIPGTVTYKKNNILRSIVSDIPDDRILLETDCPFLAPEPLRGKDNEPSFIIHTARKVAEVRGVKLNDLALMTTDNAIRLFNLPL